MAKKHKILEATYLPLRLIKKVSQIVKKEQKAKIRVLVYHNIQKNEESMFYDQLHWLKQWWNFITPQEFGHYISGHKKLKRNSLLITFDDGFISHRSIAETILNPMGIKSLFFIVTGFAELHNKSNWRKYISRNIYPGKSKNEISACEKNMSFEDLRYLIKTEHVIGAHTASHKQLSLLKNSDLVSEIVDGASRLEQKVGAQIMHFAFPFGNIKSISPEALNIARTRFSFIYTSIRGNITQNTLPWAICRDTVSATYSLPLLGSFLLGGADIYYKPSYGLYKTWGMQNNCIKK